MNRRTWVRSGIREGFDSRQQRLLDLVYSKIQYYYLELYRTGPRYQYPLSISHLMRLTNRNGQSVLSAVRVLANSVDDEDNKEPPIYYDRVNSGKNASHRPYRIFLRRKTD